MPVSWLRITRFCSGRGGSAPSAPSAPMTMGGAPGCWYSPAAPPWPYGRVGAEPTLVRGQLTVTGTPPLVTGAYLAVKKALAKHRDEPDAFVNCWLVKEMLLSALLAVPVRLGAR